MPRATLHTQCKDAQIIVLANRQPYSHERRPGEHVEVTHSASGLVHAVEPLLAACGGVWVAHGSGSADRAAVDEADCVAVPPDDPKYRLRRVWLTEEERSGYYYGFANEGLWPLCHRAFVKPVFRAADLDAYWAANARFAEAVCEEAEDDTPIVLVQDYHFALAPALIRASLPLGTIVMFWHVPWPDWQTFAICPWGAQLLDGMLGSSIIGFQTPADRDNFVDTVSSTLGAAVDRTAMTVEYGQRQVALRVYPASIPWKSGVEDSPAAPHCRAAVREALGLDEKVRIAVGVDRMDYTKGIEEKFAAVERMLDQYPEWRKRFALIQLAEPSRSGLAAYEGVRARVRAAAERINRRFGTADNCPIVLLEGHHPQCDVTRYLRAADLCVVASLHDGMNLVGKEFVRARADERGVLVLSRFAGSALELDGAVLINPFDAQGTADAMAGALTMAEAEQRARLRKMRAVVAQADAHVWAAAMLADAAALRRGQTMMPLRTAYSTTSAVL